MTSRSLRIAFAVALVALAGCASKDDGALPPKNPFESQQRVSARELRLEAAELYKTARQSLEGSDFVTAIARYDQIVLRYPFTSYATQAELERIYAYYRSFDPDRALNAADRFLREHPRHAAVDYVHYLKGLTNFGRDEASLAGMLGLDTSKEDVGNARRAFDDFALLTQKFPNSRYTADARQRMIYLRNRIAEHELHAVRFYIKRGAHIAAAKRAEQISAQYPGAPAALEALRLMAESYAAMGLQTQAADARKLYEAQLAVSPALAPREKGWLESLFSS